MKFIAALFALVPLLVLAQQDPPASYSNGQADASNAEPHSAAVTAASSPANPGAPSSTEAATASSASGAASEAPSSAVATATTSSASGAANATSAVNSLPSSPANTTANTNTTTDATATHNGTVVPSASKPASGAFLEGVAGPGAMGLAVAGLGVAMLF